MPFTDEEQREIDAESERDDSDEHEVWKGEETRQKHIFTLRRKVDDFLWPRPEADTIYCQVRSELFKIMRNLQTDGVKHLALPFDTNTTVLPKYLRNLTHLETLTFVCGKKNQDHDLEGMDCCLINCSPEEYMIPQKTELVRRYVAEAFQETTKEPTVMYKRVEVLRTLWTFEIPGTEG